MGRITKNFTLEEMYASTTAKQKKIDNTPSEKIKSNLIVLVKELLQPIRDAWGDSIVVSSGYRCPRLNKAVGGASNSQHVYGTAADIHTKSDTKEDNKRLFNLILAMKDQGKIQCRQIIDEYDYNWVHVSINDEYHSHKVNEVLHIK